MTKSELAQYSKKGRVASAIAAQKSGKSMPPQFAKKPSKVALALAKIKPDDINR